MSIAKQPHNISVRFSDEDYKQLLFLQDKFARMSYGKVSLADVLRIATKELYNIESTDMNRPITREKSYTPKPKISDSEIKDQETQTKEIAVTKQIEEENLSTKIEKENQLLQEAQQEQQNNE